MMASKKMYYKPKGGENIGDAVKRAIDLSKKNDGARVRMAFNGTQLFVNAKSKPEDVVSSFFKKCEQSGRVWENSAEGKRAARERAAEVDAKQKRLHQIVHELDSAIKGGLKTLIPWIRKYADDADDTSVDYKGDLVLKKLKAAGYQTNEYTGDVFLKGDKEVVGRYIIGQVIDCLEDKMPPHQVAVYHCDEYASMPDKLPLRRLAKKLQL